jgi:hypothetical protein
MASMKEVPENIQKENKAIRARMKARSGKALNSRIAQLRKNSTNLDGDAQKLAARRLKIATSVRQNNIVKSEYGDKWKSKAFGSAKAAAGVSAGYKAGRSGNATNESNTAVNKGNTAFNSTLLKILNKRRKAAGKTALTGLKNARQTNYDVDLDGK